MYLLVLSKNIDISIFFQYWKWKTIQYRYCFGQQKKNNFCGTSVRPPRNFHGWYYRKSILFQILYWSLNWSIVTTPVSLLGSVWKTASWERQRFFQVHLFPSAGFYYGHIEVLCNSRSRGSTAGKWIPQNHNLLQTKRDLFSRCARTAWKPRTLTGSLLPCNTEANLSTTRSQSSNSAASSFWSLTPELWCNV